VRVSEGQCNILALGAGECYDEIAAGWRHTVLRKNDGTVVACGDNLRHQRSIPALGAGESYDQIAAG